MDMEKRQFFRDRLRSARAAALADAEGFEVVVHSLELMGQYLFGKVAHLKKYEPRLSELADQSPLSAEIPRAWFGYHTEFRALYDELRQARNDAVHQGAHARTLTDHAVDLTIVLEDALMLHASKISQFMVCNVVEAKSWHPISYVRQQMLKHAFSYVPIRHDGAWHLISDASVARFLRNAKSDRNERLATRVADAAARDEKFLQRADVAHPNEGIAEILDRLGERPLLVIDFAHEDTLVGILTASDIL